MAKQKLEVIYVVASRYDDDGYPCRWRKGTVPSNSLACLRALTKNIAERDGVPGVEINVTTYDDNVQNVPIRKIARWNRRKDTRVVVGFVGVQSNQFERASDLALELRKADVPVMIGGFHVSGMLAMFDEHTPDLERLLDAGVTLVQGEAETPGVLEGILADAAAGDLKMIYRLPKAPDITDVTLPDVDPKYLKRFAVKWGTIDTSRGCPYRCSFCTIINVQGRKMRSRSGAAVIDAIRRNYEKGVTSYFFTDDNFSRSKIWREVFDGLKEMRAEGKQVTFMIQVDTQAYKIPGFVEAAGEAGCRMVFVGMESVNPENLAAVGKTQNDVSDYRNMVEAWRNVGVLVHVGYIIGFPHDTLASVRRDVEFLRDHVGVHEASFFMLTPLPGSEDHLNMVKSGQPMSDDLNDFDSYHETFDHPAMAPGEWKQATHQAYADFYTKENIVQILKRTPADKYWYMFWNCIWYRYSGVCSNWHPMSTGAWRIKSRKSRRPSMPREGVFRFAARRLYDGYVEAKTYMQLFWEFQEIWFLSRRGEAPAWEPLADLQGRWTNLRRRLAECNWSGRFDGITSEVRTVLSATSQRLAELTAQGKQLGRRQRKLLRKARTEIETFLAGMDKGPRDRAFLAKAGAFLNNSVISRYEEVADRSVRMHRRFMAWQADVKKSIRQGKLFRASYLRAPFIALAELTLIARFGFAAITKETCRGGAE